MRFGRFLSPLAFVVAGNLLCLAQATPVPAPCSKQTIAVSAVDNKSGGFISDLSAVSFRAKLHGKELKLGSVTPDHAPRRVLLLLDSSGSMINAGKWASVRKLAIATVERLDPADSFALITFGTKVDLKTDFATGPETVRAALRSLPEGKQMDKKLRKTALYDALQEALQMFVPPLFGDTLILISDGDEDNASQSSEAKASKALAATHVRMFALLSIEENSRSSQEIRSIGPGGLVFDTDGAVSGLSPMRYGRELNMEPLGLRLIADFAQLTGGRIFLLNISLFARYPDKKLPELTTRVAAMTDDVYKVELLTPGRSAKPQWLDLSVVDSKGKRREDVQLVFRPKISGCSSAPSVQP